MITRMTVLRGGRSSNDGSEVRPAPAGPRGDLGPSRRVPLPAAVVLGSVTCLVLAWGVSPEEVGRYALYLVLVVVLPGCAVWRACGPNLLYMSHELALGAAVGIALETAARLTASVLGLPPNSAVIATTALTVLLVIIPSTRARIRRPWSRLPRQAAWAQTAVLLLASIWFAYAYFREQPVTWSGRGGPENDLLFALGLAGEATHRWPMEFPWVSGEPLRYHWFFAEHLAMATQISGVDLPTILLRLDILPAVMVIAVGTGALATRMAGHPAVAAPAAALLLVVQDFSPMAVHELVQDGRAAVTGVPYDVSLWWSASGLYAALVFGPLFLLVIEVVRKQARLGHWVLLVLLLVVGVGAKASVLPVVIAAVSLVVAVEVMRSRRLHEPGFALLLASVLIFSVALVFVYGAEPQGLEVFPFGHVMTTPLGVWVLSTGAVAPTALVAVFVMLLVVLSTVPPFLPLVLLARRSGLTRDPALVACLGALALGLAALVLLYHPGQSNLYFLRTALPALAAGSAWVLHEVLPSFGAARRTHLRFVAAAFLAGLSSMMALGLWDWSDPSDGPSALRLARASAPWVGAGLMAVLVAVVLSRLVGARQQDHKTLFLVLVALFICGAGAVRVPTQVVGWVTSHPPGAVEPAANPLQHISPESVAAAQWIRDHSEPRDEVVTNVFCMTGSSEDQRACDNRTFWVAAYTERRTVLSGWGYTARTNTLATENGYTNSWQYPFWDQPRLDRLRTFLADPTVYTAKELSGQGVRYVLAVPGHDRVSPRMGEVVAEVHREGDVRVYRLPAEVGQPLPSPSP